MTVPTRQPLTSLLAGLPAPPDEESALAAGLSYPFGIVVDRAGHVLVADTFNHRIREIAL